MKKLLLLPLLFVFSLEAQAQGMCIQKVQAAVSQQGECKEFANPCAVPNEWKTVPSCDLIEDKQPLQGSSLEDRLKARFKSKNQVQKSSATLDKALKVSGKYHRIGRAMFTLDRGFGQKRLTTKRASAPRSARSYTTRNYDSIFRTSQMRAGKDEEDTESRVIERSQSKTPIRSRAFSAQRSGFLENKAKWNVQKNDHYRKKSYGANPYTLKHKYQEVQKEKRLKSNKSVDVEARKLSRLRRWRPTNRLEGSLSN